MPSVTVNPTPTSEADVCKSYGSSPFQDNTTLIVGSTAKENQDQTAWIMFEPNLPAGSTFVSVELDLYQQLLTGLLAVDWRIGWLANDGTWNVQTTSTGFGEYPGVVNPATEPTLHPTRAGASDTDWINNFPSFNPLNTTPGTAPASGTAFSFGGGTGITPTYSDADFLTDAQSAFDGNEVNRTARGVPMAVVILPSNNNAQEWTLRSNENASVADRPALTIVYNPPAIDSELSSQFTLDAEAGVIREGATELSSQTTLDAAAERDRDITSELTAQTTLDAAATVSVEAATELSAQTTLDAAAELITEVSAELSSQTTLDAAAELNQAASAELTVQATLDAATSLTAETAAELSTTTTLDASLSLEREAATELSGQITLDADAVRVLVPSAELLVQTTLDAATSLDASAAAELLAQTTLDADTVVQGGSSSELTVQTTLDAAASIRLLADAELLVTTAIDARTRASETALEPIEVRYQAANVSVRHQGRNISTMKLSANVGVRHATRNATLTATATNIRLTKPATNIEVGAE